MFTANEYIKVKSFNEAYELNQKRTNKIVAGNMMLRLSHRKLNKAIDLSGLEADYILETESEFKTGCMCTLRDLEKNEAFANCFGPDISEALGHIVGVQFRNSATVGGSIFGRFGFSDVLTYFLVLDTYVNLYKGGIIPLSEYAASNYDNDVIMEIIVNKDGRKAYYESFRLTDTDFPVISAAVGVHKKGRFFAIGARPAKARVIYADYSEFPEKLSPNEIASLAEYVSGSFNYGTNIRAGAGYRKHIAKVLTERLLKKTGCEKP